MSLELKVSVKDADLLQAISLRCSECFAAMNIANAIGGSPSVPWDMVRTFSLVEMVREAHDRKLDLSLLKAAVDNHLVVETEIYLKAVIKSKEVNHAG